MTNFIELHYAGGTIVHVNVAHITTIEPCNKVVAEKYKYNSYVSLLNRAYDDTLNVKETCEEIFSILEDKE